MNRDQIVSLRFTDAEHERLKRIAAADGVTVSEALRRMIRSALAEPLPAGVSVGNGHLRLTEVSPGHLMQHGVFWPDGTTGGTFTVHPTIEEETHGQAQ